MALGEVDRSARVAPFRQIAAQLRAGIGRNEYPAGGRLPSEADLMAHYGVARMTVRQAIAELQAEGLVVARHGLGVFVRVRPPVRRLATERFSRRHRQAGRAAFLVEVEPLGAPGVDEIDVRQGRHPAKVRELLGLSERTRAVIRVGVA